MTRTIAQHMTRAPHTIGKAQTMTRAHEMMRAHRIRHLPVLDGGAIVGIVTDRDLHLMESIDGVRPDEVPVEDVMTPDPYTVPPETPLAEVARTMAEHKYGAAVVVAHGVHVEGVFTAVDGLRLLAELLDGEGAAPARKKAAKKQAR